MREKIRSFIEKNLTVFEDETEFSDSDNIFELGIVNSLFAMKLLNFVESEFNITVSNDEIEIANFSSVDKMMQLIEKKRLGAANVTSR